MIEERSHPRDHVTHMRRRLDEMKAHLRKNIERCDEPQLRAMFETTAEVLGGLEKAFEDYQHKNESAWQSQGA